MITAAEFVKTKKQNLLSISHDHFHALMIAQLIAKDADEFPGLPATPEGKADYVLKFYEQELSNHFYIEEKILQAAILGMNSEVDEVFNEITQDHKAITDLITQLEDKNDLAEKLDKLSKILEEHVQKEEYILFRKIQENLSGEQLSFVAQKLKAEGYDNIYKF